MLKLLAGLLVLLALSGCGISYTDKKVQAYSNYCNEHNLSIKLFREGFTGSVTGMQCVDQSVEDDITLRTIQRK